MCLDDVSPEKAKAAKSRPRDGPDIPLFLQLASSTAIVQTYSAVQADPKDSTFERHRQDGASNADDGAGVVHVDGGGAGDFWEAGHEHHVAGNHTTNPAPAESEAFVTLSVQPVGAPSRLGSSDKEYCVLAIQTGNFP